MALSCPAQGSPIPAFRSVKEVWKLLFQSRLVDLLQSFLYFQRALSWNCLPVIHSAFHARHRVHLYHLIGLWLAIFKPSMLNILRKNILRCFKVEKLSYPAQGSPISSFEYVVIPIIAEPVGGSAPKFSQLASSSTISMPSTNSFSLSCPAQGSPVPAFRWDVYSVLSSEPIGGSAPKFSQLSESSKLTMPSVRPFSLSCPAQGSPVPSFRFVELV